VQREQAEGEGTVAGGEEVQGVGGGGNVSSKKEKWREGRRRLWKPLPEGVVRR